MEKVIITTMPEYNIIFDDVDKLHYSPYCLCYQYNIDDYGFGVYGFDTAKAMGMLKSVFKELILWNPCKMESELFSPNKQGISFCEKKINPLFDEVTKFRVYNSKMLLLQKMGKMVPDMKLTSPLLYRLYDLKNNVYNSEVLNTFLANNFRFLIHQFYTPEGGNCFLSFDLDVKRKIAKWAGDNNVIYEELSDINELKPY